MKKMWTQLVVVICSVGLVLPSFASGIPRAQAAADAVPVLQALEGLKNAANDENNVDAELARPFLDSLSALKEARGDELIEDTMDYVVAEGKKAKVFPSNFEAETLFASASDMHDSIEKNASVNLENLRAADANGSSLIPKSTKGKVIFIAAAVILALIIL